MKSIGFFKANTGVWDLARKYMKINGPIKVNLELPPRSVDKVKKHLD